MKTIEVSAGQTIYDVAIQEYGTRQGVFLVIQDNALSLDELLYPGQELLIRDEVPELNDTNKAVARYFARSENEKPNGNVVGVLDSAYIEDDYWDEDYSE